MFPEAQDYHNLPKDKFKRGQAAAAVTMVDCRKELRRLIGNVDAASCANMYGQMVYQRRCWVLQGSQASSFRGPRRSKTQRKQT